MTTARVGPRAERILLVSLDNIGDTVFASALARPLRERFPRAQLAVWTKEYAADVAWLIPGVTEVFASDPFWDRTPGRGKGRVPAFLRAVSAVRRRHFDIAILASAPWRTAAAVAATRVPIRIGHARRHSQLFLTDVVRAADKRQPVLRELARLLGPLDLSPGELRYELDPAPLSARVARLRGAISRPFAALHPFASVRDRCVPLGIWLAVARELEARGLTPLWIGSTRELTELRTAGSTPRSRYIDELGDGSLSDTAAALSVATVFAGHDSGPLHIAGAFGVPVLGVFAPGEPLRTFPQGIGPWRMIARAAAAEIGAGDMLTALEPLLATDKERVALRA